MSERLLMVPWSGSDRAERRKTDKSRFGRGQAIGGPLNSHEQRFQGEAAGAPGKADTAPSTRLQARTRAANMAGSH
jgi:hypothetical protein